LTLFKSKALHFQHEELLVYKHFSTTKIRLRAVIALTQGFQQNFRRKSKISDRFPLGVLFSRKFLRREKTGDY
jgi:hypothetical protein